jgi:anti-sigma B factor antagonist
MRARPPAEDRLYITATRQHRWLVLELRGELDISTAPGLTEHLNRALTAQTPPWVALNLAELAFCDLAGVGVVLRGWKRATAVGGELILLDPHPRVLRVLHTTGLDRHLTITPTPPR